MEPHLGTSHLAGGFSGAELFTRATEAFTGLLDAQGVEYR